MTKRLKLGAGDCADKDGESELTAGFEVEMDRR